MPKTKVTIPQRIEAINLLREQLPPSEIAGRMQRRYHRLHTVESVLKAYFPKKGTYCISHLRDAPQAEVLRKIGIFKAHSKNSSDAIRKRNPERRSSGRLVSKPKIPLERRFEAIDLLCAGKSETEIAQRFLQTHHPSYSLESVRRAYFPATGLYVISWLADAGKAAVKARKKEMVEARRFARLRLENSRRGDGFMQKQRAASSAHARKRNADPMILKRKYEGFRRLLQDPAYIATIRSRMQELHKDPAFERKICEGVRRYWAQYRGNIGVEAERLGIVQGWESDGDGNPQRVQATKITPASIIISQERDRIVARALAQLPELERIVCNLSFGFSGDPQPLGRVAQVLALPEKEVSQILARAIHRLGEELKKNE